MKRTIIIILLTLVYSLAAKAQFNISYSAGYGQYNMDDMKTLMTMTLIASINSGKMPQGLKLTDNFPAYVNHNIDVSYKLRKHEFGLKGTYMTTGGKIAYSDYSGKYNEKLITNGYRIAAMYRFHFYETQINQHAFSIFGELSPGITITKIKAEGEFEIYGLGAQKDKGDNYDTLSGFTIQPLAGVRFALYKRILFTVSTGYDFEFGATLGQSAYRVDWSGFRVNAGVGYSF